MKNKILNKLIDISGVVKTRDGLIIPVTFFADLVCKIALFSKHVIEDRKGTYRLNRKIN
jgi:hypothetical protein